MTLRRLATIAALAAALALAAGGTPAGAAPAPATYEVRAGDTLTSIAAAFALPSWRPLWDANRGTVADPDLIYPGQVLTIPGGEGEPAPGATAANRPAAGRGDGGGTPAVCGFRASWLTDLIAGAAREYGQSPCQMLAVAWCESNLDPGAVNPRSGAAGLFQFMPGTWRSTPQGRAGASVFNAEANAYAAAWMWSVGRRGEWVC